MRRDQNFQIIVKEKEKAACFYNLGETSSSWKNTSQDGISITF